MLDTRADAFWVTMCDLRLRINFLKKTWCFKDKSNKFHTICNCALLWLTGLKGVSGPEYFPNGP